MARRGSKKANQQGFINTYNAGQHSGAYGSAQYANSYDPSQPFGTAQQPGPQPPDWQEQAYAAAQGRSVQYADAQATFDRGKINRDFGYAADGSVDPNNPYALAALNERHHEAAARGVTNSAAAQGNLYAGSTQNAKNSELFGYLQNKNTLRNQYNDATHQTTLNQLGASTNAGSAISNDKIAALLRALGQ